MKIENLKLFTEYERQLKRKYPCSHPKIVVTQNGYCHLKFEHLVNGTIYTFGMAAPIEAKNGDVLCTVKLDSDIKCSSSSSDRILAEFSGVEFNESRKPMEMNVDNLIIAATALVNKEN
jgi:hypothetical protein